MQRREWIAGVLSAAGMMAFGCENRRGSSTGVSPRLPAGSKYSYMFSSVFQKNDSDVTEPSLSLRIISEYGGERLAGRGFQRWGAYSLKA